MRIAWFTPFDEKSAIGKVGLAICKKLSEKHDVDIWAYETEHTLKTDLKVVHYDSSTLDINSLSKYDHVLYNMGNYAGYHAHIYAAMNKFPGVVILHDRTMYNFFKQYYDIWFGDGTEESKKAFSELLKEEYGENGALSAMAYENADNMTQIYHVVYYSFIRKMCNSAKGVFTHSHEFAEKIASYTDIPVGASYLPYEPKDNDTTDISNVFKRDKSKLLIVSNGIVHPVKHIDAMVNVMLKNKDIKDGVQYVVIGSYGGEYGNKLSRLASTSLSGSLYMLGYQPNEVMNTFLAEADLFINLRYPNAESCSLSLLEQMGEGKPTIVYNSGIYGEMPNDAVVKIPLNDSEDDLADVIRNLINDENRRKQVGENALRFVNRNCTYEVYCERLTEFLTNMFSQNHKHEFNKRILENIHNEIKYLGYTVKDIPEAMDDIAYRVGTVLNAKSTGNMNISKDTVAFWCCFPYNVPGLHREGIMKLNARIAYSMLKYTPANIEIWTYDTNVNEVKEAFSDALSCAENMNGRVKVITESNWKKELSVSPMDQHLSEDISVEMDNIGTAARRYSRACVFVPVILYLDNVLQTRRPVYVPAMDMSVKYYYEDFVYKHPNMKFQGRDIEAKVNRMFSHGMSGYCMSQCIKEEQIIPLLRNARDESIGIVWTPDLSSDKTDIEFSERVLQKYGIKRPYLFYPTQLRAHKNIETLMRAFEMVVRDYPDLQLVLTGRWQENPDVFENWKKLDSIKNVKTCCDLSDEELFTLYHFAACVPVTTLIEGGFPSQAIEAMKLGTPTVLSDISVVRERLDGLGMTLEDCGLKLFEARNEKQLAENIKAVLSDPEGTIKEQQEFWEKFSSYTWKEAALKHYELMMKAAGY